MEEISKFICKGCLKEPTDRINVSRFISRLDDCFRTNVLAEANNIINYWEEEARNCNDLTGLLSVLNEKVGFSRRTNDENSALLACTEILELLDEMGLYDNMSGATMLINIATTLKAFKKENEALPLYDKASKILISINKKNTFEYASLLNNKASALCDLKQYDEAEYCYNCAIEILKLIGNHDGEIALSLIGIAHLIFDRDDKAYQKVEETLDLVWEYLNSENQPKDSNYAFILSKCAPSLRYFRREIEANALEEIANEIYQGKY